MLENITIFTIYMLLNLFSQMYNKSVKMFNKKEVKEKWFQRTMKRKRKGGRYGNCISDQHFKIGGNEVNRWLLLQLNLVDTLIRLFIHKHEHSWLESNDHLKAHIEALPLFCRRNTFGILFKLILKCIHV